MTCSGATGALAVVMVALVATHGVEYLFTTIVLMGVLQILAGLFRLVPHPVMLGFVNGLAIVIFMVVVGTFAWQSIVILRRIPLTDALVILLVTAVTVISDLAIAVVVGVVVSALAYALNNATRIHATTQTTHQGAKVYQIEGPLFFGSTHGFSEIFNLEDDPGLVIVDFINSRVVDQSALQAIEALALKYEALAKTLQLRHLSHDCHRLLNRAGQIMAWLSITPSKPENWSAADTG